MNTFISNVKKFKFKTNEKLEPCKKYDCLHALRPSNSASNFNSPAFSVRWAVENDIIKPKFKILEVGAGNLRNGLYILKKISSVKLYSYDLQKTRVRFKENYCKYQQKGGLLVGKDFTNYRYDIVICTFVLETICPEYKRHAIIKIIKKIIKENGTLIISFRGYMGIAGSTYKRCPIGEGLITPSGTFVLPYSISDAKNFLFSNGFKDVQLLKKYKVETPKNIHIIARKDILYGKKMA